MAYNRKDYCSQESGIALVTALVIVACCLLLISGVWYMLTGGWRIATLNKQFSTVQEAAAGGAQHVAEVVRLVHSDGTLSNLGIQDSGGKAPTDIASDIQQVIYKCDTTKGGARVLAKTGDGRYAIDMTIRCIGFTPIPGGGGSLRFPPPPTNTASPPSFFVFYSITSEARDNTTGPEPKIARVETVYRYAR